MKNLAIFFLLFANLFFNSCSILSEKNVQKIVEDFPQVTPLTIAKIVQDEINESLKKLNSPSRINIDVTTPGKDYYDEEVSTTDVDFVFVPFEGELLFDPNKYKVRDSIVASHYISAITSYIKSLRAAFPGTEIGQLALTGNFIGGADSLGYGQTVGYYLGECGDIEEDDVMLQGKYVNVRIYSGNSIKNVELAFIRAYCLYYDFIDRTSELGINRNSFESIKFTANEYDDIGSKYRFARLSIAIKPKSE